LNAVISAKLVDYRKFRGAYPPSPRLWRAKEGIKRNYEKLRGIKRK
jgi:hypothetical protein